MPDPRPTRLTTPGLADYHCHCDFSIDAQGTIDEYCEAALVRGLVELCFTTHYDANPDSQGEVDYICVNGDNVVTNVDNLQHYVNAVCEAGARFSERGLTVRLGLEFGWYQDCESEVRRLTDRYDFDYLLCGIHELENVCFCCDHCFEKCFGRYPLEEMVKRYVGHLQAAADTGLFDTIAHIDYVRKYGERYYGPGINEALAKHWPEFFEVLKATGTGLEINTAALRKGLDDYYPIQSVSALANASGVRLERLGSDAHRPWDVGADFDRAVTRLGGAIDSDKTASASQSQPRQSQTSE